MLRILTSFLVTSEVDLINFETPVSIFSCVEHEMCPLKNKLINVDGVDSFSVVAFMDYLLQFKRSN